MREGDKICASVKLATLGLSKHVFFHIKSLFLVRRLYLKVTENCLKNEKGNRISTFYLFKADCVCQKSPKIFRK